MPVFCKGGKATELYNRSDDTINWPDCQEKDCVFSGSAAYQRGLSLIHICLEVLDAGSGEKLGVVADVLTPPAHEVYVVKGEHEYMIPAVDEFLAETNVEGGYIKVRLIEGMRTDV